jgi:hypothetical protein
MAVSRLFPASLPRSGRPAAAAFALAAFALASSLSGCQQLFTTSLASSLARKTLSIPTNLTPAQAATLAIEAKSDPALATALVGSLVTEINSTSDPTVKAQLEESAASAAVVASGASSAITSLITSYTTNPSQVPDAATLSSLLATVQAGATPSVVTALSYLDPSNLTPAQVTAAGLGPTDLAVAAVVVASSVIPPGTDLTTVATDPALQNTIETQTDAVALMQAAENDVPAGSQSSSLLNSVSQLFVPPTTPTS